MACKETTIDKVGGNVYKAVVCISSASTGINATCKSNKSNYNWNYHMYLERYSLATHTWTTVASRTWQTTLGSSKNQWFNVKRTGRDTFRLRVIPLLKGAPTCYSPTLIH